MFVALQRSPNGSKLCSYQEKKRREKKLFKIFGVLSPKDVLRKTRRSERMVVRRKSSGRSVKRGGSFKEENYGQPVVFDVLSKLFYLVFHFIVVIGCLTAFAYIFMKLEDSATRHNSISLQGNKSRLSILECLEKKYNLSLSLNHLESVLTESTVPSTQSLTTEKLTRYQTFKKWFYFVSIASTTIGYGDVAPSTKEGRITYIMFSFIAIPLMLSFIFSLGDKIRQIHVGLLSMFKQWLTDQQNIENTSDLLAFLLIIISFTGHVSIGCALIRNTSSWNLVDRIYHHIGTFTTVGLGDLVEPLEEQINSVYALFFYRIFGLALLFASFRSLYFWYKIKREAFEVKKLIQRPLKTRTGMSTLFCRRSSRMKEGPKLESTMLI